MVKNSRRLPELNRAQVISVLRMIRQEWEEACNGTSAVVIHGSVGLLLGDVADALGFEADEKSVILGTSLSREIDLIS